MATVRDLRKKQIMEAFDRFVEENGYSPTIRELVDMVPVSSTSIVHSYVNELIEDGVLEGKAKSARTLRRVAPKEENR